MKTLEKLMIVILSFAALLFPPPSLAQKVTLDKVKVTVQPLTGGEYQLHFEFALPNFDGAAVEKVNIDYAVLKLEVQVVTISSTPLNMLEVLVAAANKTEPLLNLEYNANPVTARIRRATVGVESVEVDLTQVVEHWVHRGVANNGLLLVSHRRVSDKTLWQGVVAIPANPQLTVTIFYTLSE